MAAAPLSVPIRPWVPRWLGILTAFVIMLPVILINGAYTGSAVEISSTLGVLGEDIRMAYYATAAGIAVSYPLVPDVRKAVTTKTVLLIDLLLQALLSFICAQTTQMDIVIVCSFWIGILKGFAMIEVINMVKPLFSPADIRSEFYAYFYPIVFSGGQLSIALTAQLAYHYQWQHMYYFIILLLLVAVMFVLLFFRYSRQPLRFPVHEIDGRSVLLISSVLLLSIYVATYGQMLDWFASKKLVVYTVLIPFLLWLFIHRQQTLPKPYLKLDVLNDIKPLVGYLYMMLAMFFSSTSTLVTNYVNTVLHVDNVHANLLYLGLIPGFAVGGAICYWWFRYQRWKFRFLIAGGMACFTTYLAILYFGISPDATYEILYLPTFLKGLGMMIIFIAFGIYVVEDLPPSLTIYNAFFLISFRSALAPALSTSFFSNLLYRLQQQGLTRLADHTTALDPLAAQQYDNALHSALALGHGIDEAGQIATQSLYSTLQTQTMLLELKTIFGYLLIFAIVATVVSRFIPFHKTVKVRIVKTGEDMV